MSLMRPFGWRGYRHLQPVTGVNGSYQDLVNNHANLLGWWKLNEASGATFVDSKAAHNATVNSVTLGSASTYVVGETPSLAATFNGTSGYASIGDIAGLEFTRAAPWTINAIVKPNVLRSGGSLDYWIYTKSNPATTLNGLNFGLKWLSGATCEVQVQFIANYPTQAIYARSSAVDLQNGTEYMVTVTYDGAAASTGIKIYVDGVSVGVVDGSGGAASQTIAVGQDTTAAGFAAEIGRRTSLNKWYKGDLKDLAIYGAAMSAIDVARLAWTAHQSPQISNPLYVLNAAPQVVFYDMDMDSDIDDVVDAVLLLNLEHQGKVSICGSVVTSASQWAPATWIAIANYYGRGSVPCGINQSAPGNTGPSAYNTTIATNYGVPGRTLTTDFEASTVTQRRSLSAASNNSVNYITTGDLSSVKLLLQTGADAFSPLSGVNLVAQKCKALFVVAGTWPSSSGSGDLGSSATRANSNFVLTNWPTTVPIIFINLSDGTPIETGANVMEALNAANPARAAWELYFGNALVTNKRPAWAQIGMMALAKGMWPNSLSTDYLYPVGYRGTASVHATTGATAWASTPNSNHSYTGKLAADATFVTDINASLRDPSNW